MARALGARLAWALMPKRIGGMPNLLAAVLRTNCWRPTTRCPIPSGRYDNPPGLAGIVHDFSGADFARRLPARALSARPCRAAEMVVAAAALAAVLR